MDIVKESIEQIRQNPGIVAGAAVLLFLIIGIIIRKLRLFLLLLLIGGVIVFYMLTGSEKIKKNPVDEIRKKVKTRVMQSL